MDNENIEAVDLFAGTGWGVALKRLGVREHGVEKMPAAIATREANGMRTWMEDVWDVLTNAPTDSPEFEAALLIASPPCQTFSMAGKGAGRKALDEVLGLIHSRDYLDPIKLRAFGDKHDDRTALVLTPLAYVAEHLPRLVVFEQVPTVLPVWEACADEMRKWGYSVVTGVLNAEQYGVPQTRKRAILIGRWDKEARMPRPTHSAYYSRDRARLDEGVLPWVSMAEALGWGMTERPYMTVAAGTASGGTDPAYLGGSGARAIVKSEQEGGRWKLRGNYSTTAREGLTPSEGSKLPRVERELHEPAMTMTSKYPRWATIVGGEAIRLTDAEAAVVQSYPAEFEWRGNRGDIAQQIGNAVPPLLAEAILREVLS